MTLPFVSNLIAVALGGSAGALLRYGTSMFIVRHWPERMPVATLLVNAVGCFLIGVLATLVEGGAIVRVVAAGVITGLLGSLTTFSTFAYETLLPVWSRGRFDLAMLNIALNLLLGLTAVLLGRGLVRWLFE